MTVHPIDRDDARFGAEAHLRYGGGGDDLAENVLALLDLLAAAEHRATRAETRIKAVQNVLDSDAAGPGKEPLIHVSHIRRALDGDA